MKLMPYVLFTQETCPVEVGVALAVCVYVCVCFGREHQIHQYVPVDFKSLMFPLHQRRLWWSGVETNIM